MMDFCNKVVHIESVAKSERRLIYDDGSNKIYCNSVELGRVLEEPSCLWKIVNVENEKYLLENIEYEGCYLKNSFAGKGESTLTLVKNIQQATYWTIKRVSDNRHEPSFYINMFNSMYSLCSTSRACVKRINNSNSDMTFHQWKIRIIRVSCDWVVVSEQRNETRDLLRIDEELTYSVKNTRCPKKRANFMEKRTICKLLSKLTEIADHCAYFKRELGFSITSSDIWLEESSSKAKIILHANEELKIRQIRAICGNYVIKAPTVQFITKKFETDTIMRDV
ncbi:DgyrCDS2865 [Dimorphilus gyrociliatus]|uniref:DgyrCDS2865 n=1 Tax=Dimorphilus gyrociliatus TaxID=2664684 RepID=A0A7I8VBI7_9ANNE|nr:DgyrCDS2865 [Dimorphilus gyrociliatus]